MNINTNIIETCQYNFCRLTGLKREEYQQILFECGCNYAEEYSRKIVPSEWKALFGEMLQLSAYWDWWKELWMYKTLEAFKIAGIEENSENITPTDSLFLLEAFYDFNSSPVRPNLSVLQALKEKIYKNEKLCKITPFQNTNLAREKSGKKSLHIEQGNLRGNEHNRADA